jgi:hypothetical protein
MEQDRGGDVGGTSLLLPRVFARLADPGIKTVLLAGCGGGFDFVHSAVLIPELVRMGKRLVIGSYSFGDPDQLVGPPAEEVFRDGDVIAKRVTAACRGPEAYAPELHFASFLDERYPDSAPHSVYAYYARSFTVTKLRRLYAQLVERHEVDAILLVDGGSDSLMRGDEDGLGDPLEDAVSVAAVATLEAPRVTLRALLSIGLGADRFNGVSDAASLRAIAELTAQGGFLGGLCLEPGSEGIACYRACVQHIYARQTFRSVLTGCILAAAEGSFGDEEVPQTLRASGRVAPGDVFLWPLMAMVWAFDVQAVARRSVLIPWIRDAPSVAEMNRAFMAGRAKFRIRPVEELPHHVDFDPLYKHAGPREGGPASRMPSKGAREAEAQAGADGGQDDNLLC